MRAGKRKYRIAFIEATTTTDDYNQPVEDWDDPATIATTLADVRFGTAQEKREAAQESGVQSASFECLRTPTLDAVLLTARISFDGSQWDITERAPLDFRKIRFTAARNV